MSYTLLRDKLINAAERSDVEAARALVPDLRQHRKEIYNSVIMISIQNKCPDILRIARHNTKHNFVLEGENGMIMFALQEKSVDCARALLECASWEDCVELEQLAPTQSPHIHQWLHDALQDPELWITRLQNEAKISDDICINPVLNNAKALHDILSRFDAPLPIDVLIHTVFHGTPDTIDAIFARTIPTAITPAADIVRQMCLRSQTSINTDNVQHFLSRVDHQALTQNVDATRSPQRFKKL